MGLIQKIENSKIIKIAAVVAGLSTLLNPIYNIPESCAQEPYNRNIEKTINAYMNRKSHEKYQNEDGLRSRDNVFKIKEYKIDAEPKQKYKNRNDILKKIAEGNLWIDN